MLLPSELAAENLKIRASWTHFAEARRCSMKLDSFLFHQSHCLTPEGGKAYIPPHDEEKSTEHKVAVLITHEMTRTANWNNDVNEEILPFITHSLARSL